MSSNKISCKNMRANDLLIKCLFIIFFSLLYNEMFFFLNQKIGFQVNIILFDNKIDLFSIRKVMFEIYKS